MNEQVWRRRIERHCAATIRALSGVGNAEYAQWARVIAKVVDEICQHSGEGEDLADAAIASRYRLLLPLVMMT